MVRTTIAQLLDAIVSTNNTVNTLADRVNALANGSPVQTITPTPDNDPAPVTVKAVSAPVKSTKKAEKIAGLSIVGRSTVRGKLGTDFTVKRGGQAVQMADGSYLNGSKLTVKAPFKGIADGALLDVVMLTYTQENGKDRDIVESVSKVSKAPVVKAAAPSKDADQEVGLIRQSVPSSKNPDGCVFCGGSVHDKGGSGYVAQACLLRQFVKATGVAFTPVNASEYRRLADWLDANEIRVSKGNGDTVGAKRGGSASTQTTAPVKAAAPVKAPKVQKNAPAAPVTVTAKLTRISSSNSSAQCDGHKVRWFKTEGAHALFRKFKVGQTVTMTLDANGMVTDVVKAVAPKA